MHARGLITPERSVAYITFISYIKNIICVSCCLFTLGFDQLDLISTKLFYLLIHTDDCFKAWSLASSIMLQERFFTYSIGIDNSKTVSVTKTLRFALRIPKRGRNDGLDLPCSNLQSFFGDS